MSPLGGLVLPFSVVSQEMKNWFATLKFVIPGKMLKWKIQSPLLGYPSLSESRISIHPSVAGAAAVGGMCPVRALVGGQREGTFI